MANMKEIGSFGGKAGKFVASPLLLGHAGTYCLGGLILFSF